MFGNIYGHQVSFMVLVVLHLTHLLVAVLSPRRLTPEESTIPGALVGWLFALAPCPWRPFLHSSSTCWFRHQGLLPPFAL